MKPTYEELEAQAAAYRQTLIDIKKLGPYIKVPLDLARPEELADEALLSTAGQSLLTRLETLEKALDMVCGKIDSCPSKIEFMKCNLRLNESKCRDCRRVYFINKAGKSK
jgi:hypothetical protein